LRRENESKNFEQIKRYYIQRKLRRFIQIDRKLLEKKKDDKEKENQTDDFIIVHTKEEFNEKCSQKLKNVHYLIQDQSNPNHHLLWQNSNGPISTLKKFVITNKECEESIDEEEIFHKNDEKVLIISAEPGMGKSLILDNFTQNSSAENFFIKIVLNTCTDALSKLKCQKVANDSIEFVLKSLLNKTNEQEISLLKHLASKEKLILMFDGLDEVTDHKQQVIDLIDALYKDKRIKKILITTRNQLREELEDHFGTFSFNLNNFDEKDQKNFLCKYWHYASICTGIMPEFILCQWHLEQSATDIITKIKSSELIGIPLLAQKLAYIFVENLSENEEVIISKLSQFYKEYDNEKIKRNEENILDKITSAEVFEKYNMEHDRRGIALVINIRTYNPNPYHLQERVWSEKDVENLKYTLEYLEFDLKLHQDLKADEIRDKIQEISKLDHTNSDCFLCVVMAHGNEDKIVASDNQEISFEEIMKPIKECPTLIGKPKLFFFQACRGENEFGRSRSNSGKSSSGNEEYSYTDMAPYSSKEKKLNKKKEHESDLFIFYATGHYSFGTEAEGTCFIKSVCEVFNLAYKNLPNNMSLTQMIIRINEEVKQKAEQMTDHRITFTKELYFMPKNVSVFTLFFAF
jgi:hypothetical protein